MRNRAAAAPGDCHLPGCRALVRHDAGGYAGRACRAAISAGRVPRRVAVVGRCSNRGRTRPLNGDSSRRFGVRGMALPQISYEKDQVAGLMRCRSRPTGRRASAAAQRGGGESPCRARGRGSRRNARPYRRRPVFDARGALALLGMIPGLAHLHRQSDRLLARGFA
jgi:hypothetical protein